MDLGAGDGLGVVAAVVTDVPLRNHFVGVAAGGHVRLVLIVLAVTLLKHFFNLGDSPVDELLFGQERLENDLTILTIKSVQILRLHFLFTNAFNAVEHAELRHVEETLLPVELYGLQWINAEVDLSEQWQVLDVAQLDYLSYIIQAHIQKLQALNLFEASEA